MDCHTQVWKAFYGLDHVGIPSRYCDLHLFQGKALFSPEVWVRNTPIWNTEGKWLGLDALLIKFQMYVHSDVIPSRVKGQTPPRKWQMVPQTKFSSLPAPSIQTCRLQIVRKNVWFEVIPQLQLASQTTFFLPSSLSPVFKKKKKAEKKNGLEFWW